MTRRLDGTKRRRGPLGLVLAHHREHEAHHVVMLMVFAGALALIATIFVAGAAGFVNVASHIRHANTYWLPFALVGAVAAHIGYVFAYREVAHVDRGVRLGNSGDSAPAPILAAGTRPGGFEPPTRGLEVRRSVH